MVSAALLAILTLPTIAFPQSTNQDKRGIEVSRGSEQTSKETDRRSVIKPGLVIQAGHTKPVNAVVFSPDARWLASGSKDDTIKIWDIATGNVLRTLYGHSSNVNALAVSPDGKLLASGSGDRTDKRDISTFKGGGVVGGMQDNTVKLWDVESGRELKTFPGHELPVGAVAFSPDGRSLTTVSGDSIKVWDLTTGNELRSQNTKYDKSGAEKFDSFRSFSIFGRDKRDAQQADWFKNLKLSASKIVVSPDGKLAAVGQPDKSIRIYDANAGRELRELTFKATPEAENSSLAFSSDARLIAYAKTGDIVSVEEVSTGRELHSLKTQFSKNPERVAFSNDGRFLITASGDDATMKLWEVAKGEYVREFRASSNDIDTRVMSFSQDARLLATVAAGSKAIRITDVATGNELRTLQTATNSETEAPAQSAFLKSIDPKTLAELKERGINSTEQIVDAIESLGTIANDKFPVGHGLTTSPDGRYLISRHMLLQNVVSEVWDMKTGTPIKTSDDTLADRGKPHFSPDGRYKFTVSFPMKGIYTTSANDYNIFSSADDWEKIYDQKVQLYEGTAGRKLRELNGGKASEVGIVPAVGFSFDGSYTAITGFEKKDRVILVYESASGRRVNRVTLDSKQQNEPVTTLSLSAGGRLLAAAQATRIQLFELSNSGVRTLPHSGKVASLTFSPDDRFLFALGENNDRYIWDTATGEKLATLIDLSGPFTNGQNDWLVVTPDGLFDGSPGGWKQILWQFGGNTFDVTPAETFFNEFYYPGLLGEIMSGTRPRAPRTLAQLDRRQPTIRLATQLDDASSKNISDRQLLVKVAIKEKTADGSHVTGSGARDVRLFRNGSLVKVWRGDVLKGQSETTLETTIPVVSGDNRLTAYAFNRDNVKSKDAELNLVGSESLRRDGTAYILAIGINAYENSQYNLKFAAADAQAFGEEVTRQQQKLSRYKRVEIISLSDQEATKTNIIAALRRFSGVEDALPQTAPAALKLIQTVQPEDAVLVFYAGHGTAHGQRFYLIPHDLGYQGNRSALDAAGFKTILDHSISDEELELAVEGLDASNLLMVIDACNSGQALEAEEKRRGPMNSKGLAQLAYEKGMYILTAAQGYQAALESSQLGHGYLTYALIEEGLKTNAADAAPKDNLVFVREWLDFATERVPQMQEAKIKSRDLTMQSSGATSGAQKPTVDATSRDIQRPRVFYRREIEAKPLVVAKR